MLESASESDADGVVAISRSISKRDKSSRSKTSAEQMRGSSPEGGLERGGVEVLREDGDKVGAPAGEGASLPVQPEGVSQGAPSSPGFRGVEGLRAPAAQTFGLNWKGGGKGWKGGAGGGKKGKKGLKGFSGMSFQSENVRKTARRGGLAGGGLAGTAGKGVDTTKPATVVIFQDGERIEREQMSSAQHDNSRRGRGRRARPATAPARAVDARSRSPSPGGRPGGTFAFSPPARDVKVRQTKSSSPHHAARCRPELHAALRRLERPASAREIELYGLRIPKAPPRPRFGI